MALLVGLVVLVAAGIGALWLLVSSGPDSAPPPSVDGPRTSAAGASSAAGELPVLPPDGGGARPDAAPGGTPGPLDDPRRFDGRGSIRGQVVVDPGIEFPERFTVAVGPSRQVIGGERAVTKRVEYPGAAEEFLVDDLPLGGYDIWVEAAGMNSRRTAVLLVKTSAHPYVILKIFPTGFIDGSVIRADGSPAGEVKLTLERFLTKERRSTQTRPDGMYRFDDVADGEYRLIVGPPETPLTPVRELSFQAPSMRFPQITLPAVVDVRLGAQDRTGRPLSGVAINGFGDRGGRIEVITDGTGTAWATHLPPGRYRVTGRAEDGRTARTTLEIDDSPDQQYWLLLR